MKTFKRFTNFLEKHLFGLAMVAIICAVAGAYLLSLEKVGPDAPYVFSGDTLEPLARGLKVLWGTDSYRVHIVEIPEWNNLQRLGYVLFGIGRWIGFIVFFRSLYTVLALSFDRVTSESAIKRQINRGEDVVSVYGDSAYAVALVKRLREQGVPVAIADKRLSQMLGDDAPRALLDLSVAINAPRQMLLFDRDQEAIEFIERNGASMRDDTCVYVRLDGTLPAGMTDERVMPFSIAEICAQLYWDEHPVYPSTPSNGVKAKSFARTLCAKHKGCIYRIVIVGSGNYAEAILEQGILTNIFDVAGGVRYDVIGDFRHYGLMHPGLQEAISVNADELCFHEGSWYEHLELLLDADRVILCGHGTDNVRIAGELQSEPLGELHVRAHFANSLRIMGDPVEGGAGPTKVVVFGSMEEVCTAPMFMQDRIHERGKLRDIIYGLGTPRCNACASFDFAAIPKVPDDWGISDEDREAIRDSRIAYMYADSGEGIEACLGCPMFKEEWNSYDGFTRRSNYAVAAHDGQKFRLLRRLGIDVSNRMSVADETIAYRSLDEGTRHALQEIEHIRWCRFHYINGWSFAPGEKDKRARTHPDLVPYSDLSTDQSKDADAYLNLCLTIRDDEQQRELEDIWLQ